MTPRPGFHLPVAALLCVLASASCTKQVSDREARKFYREELSVFLDSLAYEVCQLKYDDRSHAADAPGKVICPGKGLPSPRAPTWAMLASANQPMNAEKDSEARRYIRNELQPWIDSLAKSFCAVKVGVAPDAPGKSICGPSPEGYTKPPSNGAP
jgi:hypothetical protein